MEKRAKEQRERGREGEREGEGGREGGREAGRRERERVNLHLQGSLELHDVPLSLPQLEAETLSVTELCLHHVCTGLHWRLHLYITYNMPHECLHVPLFLAPANEQHTATCVKLLLFKCVFVGQTTPKKV